MHHTHRGNVAVGNVRWSPAKSLWWTGMVCADRDDVRGLPALLIAIGSRNMWTAAGALALLPLATMCEMVRGQFQA
ncbi:hypothetical protein HAV22_24460 [Massilia sp. TW-1]|uniref:Uncharacterized protein n=1 Tax=Telluria antibiotica TaxID=2717319 RepID=A0ABX0PHM0_9BURK|nr:hypothetical protein [Telluria antibiotica]NIA56779.1 hypothetical protein [Telluria antibiotica]